MEDKMLVGFWRYITPVPRVVWQRPISRQAKKLEAELNFMSEEHHTVRNYVVRELPRIGKPLYPEYIAEKLDLLIARVYSILDDLEKHITFLCRY